MGSVSTLELWGINNSSETADKNCYAFYSQEISDVSILLTCVLQVMGNVMLSKI